MSARRRIARVLLRLLAQRLARIALSLAVATLIVAAVPTFALAAVPTAPPVATIDGVRLRRFALMAGFCRSDR